MEAAIRPLENQDRPAVALLLDATVGAGFWSFVPPEGDLSFVAAGKTGPAGIVLAALEPAGDAQAERELLPAAARVETAVPVLHVHAVAVAPPARRAGLARRLLEHVESEAAARGAPAAYLYAWLPAGRPEPGAVRLYRAAGYDAGPDIGDFYARASVASGAHCPYCGAPPCRCAARTFVKRLLPA